MKKRIFTLLVAALMLLSLCACSSDDKGESKDVEISPIDPITGETLSGDDEYVWELVETQIIAPDGTPVESMPEFEKIAGDAAVQSLEDITNLDEIVAGYQTCYNYDLNYDESIIFAANGNYYLVKDDEAKTGFTAECAKYFEAGTYPPCVIEKDGSLYYKPVEKDVTLTIDMGEDNTGLNYSEGDTCELSYTDAYGNYHTIELTKGDNGFLISYTTAE